MSLIQEALKRKAEEEKAQQLSEAAPAAPVSARKPESTTPDPAPQTAPRKDVWIIALIILIILLLVGGAFYFLKGATGQAAAPQPEPVAAQPDVIKTPPALPLPVAEKNPAAETKGAKWPELRMTGTATTSGGSLAIINGKMLSAGRTIDGVRIIKVGATEVLVEYQNERRILRVDDE